MLPRDDQSWEDAGFAAIAHDRHLLHTFQTLKYINGRSLNDFNSLFWRCNADLEICVAALLVLFLLVSSLKNNSPWIS